MAISVNWVTGEITVPRADMPLVQASPEIREHDIDAFRLTLRDMEDDPDGRPWSRTHNHNTTITIAGVIYARSVEIIDPYFVTYEDGAYVVNLVGANNNVFVKRTFNSVSVNPSNSAGAQVVTVESTIDPTQFVKDGKILTIPFYMGNK